MDQGIKKLYYSISEVSKITDLKPYVLRYGETEFKQLAPPKNRAGNRTYRQKDIDFILLLKDLLHEQKFTIEGARKKLAEKPAPVEEASTEAEPAVSPVVATAEDENTLSENVVDARICHDFGLEGWAADLEMDVQCWLKHTRVFRYIVGAPAPVVVADSPSAQRPRSRSFWPDSRMTSFY